VKVRNGIGKAVTLALFSLSLASCGNPLERDPTHVDEQSLGKDASSDLRAFYEARQWQAAWDERSKKQLVEIISGAPSQGLKPELFLKAALPEDKTEREIALTKAALGYASAHATGFFYDKAIS
jgi:hypothetical protein